MFFACKDQTAMAYGMKKEYRCPFSSRLLGGGPAGFEPSARLLCCFCFGGPTSCVSDNCSSNSAGRWKRASASARGSHGIFTTLCCKASTESCCTFRLLSTCCRSVRLTPRKLSRARSIRRNEQSLKDARLCKGCGHLQ